MPERVKNCEGDTLLDEILIQPKNSPDNRQAMQAHNLGPIISELHRQASGKGINMGQTWCFLIQST